MSSARSLLVLAALAVAACSPPEPPTFKPISGRVTAITADGLDIEAKVEAYNPNDFDIPVESCTATVTLDHKYNVGTVTMPRPVTLPAQKKKLVDLPISLKWNDVASLAPLALVNRDIPWDADVKVKVDAKATDVVLPFKVSGVVTHQQIVTAVGRSLPRIPGIF